MTLTGLSLSFPFELSRKSFAPKKNANKGDGSWAKCLSGFFPLLQKMDYFADFAVPSCYTPGFPAILCSIPATTDSHFLRCTKLDIHACHQWERKSLSTLSLSSSRILNACFFQEPFATHNNRHIIHKEETACVTDPLFPDACVSLILLPSFSCLIQIKFIPDISPSGRLFWLLPCTFAVLA